MRRFLVLVLLVFLAMPVMARADDYEGLVGKLETILTNLTTGYNQLIGGLTDLQAGQEQLKTAQAELYGGLNQLYEGLNILHAEQEALSQDVIVLASQLNSLEVSYADYKIGVETEIKNLNYQIKRQRAFLVGGGALAGAVCIVTLYIGGR